jgi:hypothetical protein
MERYKELHRQQMISFQPEREGLFSLPPSIVDTEIKPNGEAVYRINWEEIKASTFLPSSASMGRSTTQPRFSISMPYVVLMKRPKAF